MNKTSRILFAGLLLTCSAHLISAQSSSARALELAERDFQRATLEKGVDGWNSFFADSGAQLQNTSRIVRGHSAIKSLMGDFLASRTERLIWWPVATEVSEKGDMAYTFGASGVVAADSSGRLGIEGRGTYLTVWRKQRNGSWKVTADMGGQASARALERAADTGSVREITRIEQERSTAILAMDRAALERIYAYDFLGVTADGRVVNRSEVLPVLVRNHTGERFATESLVVSVAGETGIVSGILRRDTDSMTSTRSSFLHVYVRRHGKWVFIRGLASAMR